MQEGSKGSQVDEGVHDSGLCVEAEYPVFIGFHREDAADQARCVLSRSHDTPGIAGI